jgi:peptidoglycan hydrolase CwlO-like protein
MGSLKLYIGIGIVAVAFGAGFAVNGWRLGTKIAKQDTKIAALTNERDTARGQLAGANGTVEAQRKAIEKQNAAVADLKAKGDALQAAVNKVSAAILSQRAEYERKLAQAASPLPAGCEDAVRETARRLGAKQ